MSAILSIAARASEVYGNFERLLGRNPFAPQGVLNIDPRQYWGRRYLSFRYLRGEGAEIGALHQPLPLYFGAKAKYIDRMSVRDLRKHYQELATFDLVEPDLIEDGEKLTGVAEESLDFLIANHFIEHCKNPIRTISTHLSKIKRGGYLFMAVPNRDFTFDKDRPLTPFEHCLSDYNAEVLPDQTPHYEEWVRLVSKVQGEEAIKNETTRLMNEDYSIHFHVWNGRSFRELLQRLEGELSFPMKTIEQVEWRYNPFEVVYLIQKR